MFLRLLIFLAVSLQCTAYEYKLSVVSVFQNEARFMKEWIEYHKLVGVEHFWLYNNDSTDNYIEVLAPYIADGTVELFYWPNLWPETWFALSCQPKAFNDALHRSKDKTKWLAAIDMDEFIVPLEGIKITDILEKKFKHYPGVCVYWKVFGTNNVYFIEPTELMCEKLTKFSKNSTDFKSIVKPKYVSHFEGPHHCHYLKGNAVNTNKETFRDYGLEKSPIYKYLQINHYWTRDIYNIETVKWPRYHSWGEKSSLEQFIEGHDALNQYEDTAILKFVPALKNRM